MAVTSMGILFAGCNSPVFTPIASPNPWQDDYSFLSSMDNYRSWGTYNVHDPSCRKLGDYYYMYSTDAILGWWMTVWQLVEQLIWIIEVYTIILKMDVL